MGTVTFGCFPRSGNFFLTELFKKNAPSVGVHWVEHNASLLTKCSDSFTVIRNPLDCVPSWIAYKNDVRVDRAEKVLEWYCNFYNQCFSACIKVFTFDYLTSDPIGLLSEVCEVESNDLNKKYFYNETRNKSDFQLIVEEMKSSPSFDHAFELFLSV